MKVVLELDPHEALMVLDPIQDKALAASHKAASLRGEQRDYAERTAAVCRRVATAIVDALDPTCSIEYADGTRCESPVDINGMCNYHDRMTA